MTIDSLSVFFWAWAVLIFWKAIHREKRATGFGWGWPSARASSPNSPTACSSSASAVSCFGPRNIARCSSAGKCSCLGGAFGLSILPILWWNIQTHWVHYIALHDAQRGEKLFRFIRWNCSPSLAANSA
jgi:hypothetical protein